LNFVAFGTSGVPTIALLDRSRAHLPIDLKAYAVALQEYFDAVFTPDWGIAAKIVLRDKPEPEDWPLPIEHKCPDKGTEGEHWLTAVDRPKGLIGIKDTLDAGDVLSDVIAHEAGEMAVDPGGNILVATNEAQDHFVAAEPFDPTQATPGDAPHFSRIEIAGFLFPNFVTKKWFDFRCKPSDGPFDHLGLCERPLQVLEGGYISEFKHGKWDERFGSHHAKLQFSKRKHARVMKRGSR
jgi:hypothetical protein